MLDHTPTFVTRTLPSGCPRTDTLSSHAAAYNLPGRDGTVGVDPVAPPPDCMLWTGWRPPRNRRVALLVRIFPLAAKLGARIPRRDCIKLSGLSPESRSL